MSTPKNHKAPKNGDKNYIDYTQEQMPWYFHVKKDTRVVSAITGPQPEDLRYAHKKFNISPITHIEFKNGIFYCITNNGIGYMLPERKRRKCGNNGVHVTIDYLEQLFKASNATFMRF